MTRWRSWHVAFAALSLLFVVNAYWALATLNVFGLDEVHYYPDFTFKLKEEGRWLNYLLHHGLRALSLQAHALLFVVTSWASFFRVARRVGWHPSYCAMVASVVLLAPPTVQESLWPATLLPSALVFLLAVIGAELGVAPRFVYLGAGVLLFGAMQSYYFMVPLVFLPELVERAEGANPWRVLLQHASLWVAGAVVGVVGAVAAVYVLTGQVGIAPADWRHTMPIHGAGDVVRNAEYVVRAFASKTLGLWQAFSGGSWLFGALAVLCLAIQAFEWLRFRARLAALVTVAFSFFAFSLPLAPIILERSLVALSFALALLLLVSPRQTKFAGGLAAVLLLWAAWHLSVSGRAYLDDEQATTGALLSQVRRALPVDGANYRAFAIFGHAAGSLKEAQRYNSPPWLRPILMTAGARDYWDCRAKSPACDALAARFSVATLPPADSIRFLGVSDEGVAVLYFGSP